MYDSAHNLLIARQRERDRESERQRVCFFGWVGGVFGNLFGYWVFGFVIDGNGVKMRESEVERDRKIISNFKFQQQKL